MHIHILGICGTFMGGIAMIAKQAGFKVTGSDLNVYPPMSTELEHAGIELIKGFDASTLDTKPDLIVVGNVMKRGMPVIERML
ncbi:MAG: UDP-N-acetylmuramate:L-alanyl-gamma-D-glutamyl-meso-diaminopimelate ligase, partial [Succinivibrio sp.]|nr:UDP-N-acetylmuramate:L-alanyl-gamma-D-glutamyl-meso-diaminopimelate ligase [Succinivibrio sp.]